MAQSNSADTSMLATNSAGAIGYRAAVGGSAIERSVEQRLTERISLLDFDVDPTGNRESTAGFLAAMEALGAGTLYVPAGTYVVAPLGLLGLAGRRIQGASRWKSVIRLAHGGGALFANEASHAGTSAFHSISDLTIDLGGFDAVGIDLASINATVISRVHFRSGGNYGQTIGTGLRFAAPLQRGAYDNCAHDCSFEGFARAIVWDSGANNNSVSHCRVINSDIAFDAAPEGLVDTPRIFGGRAEACRIGLREGASNGCYIGVRFEDSELADIQFTQRSNQAMIMGGSTAGSRVALLDQELANSPHVESSDLGYRQIEHSVSRPKISSGRHIFGKAGPAPAPHPATDYAAFFADNIVIANSCAIAFGSVENGDVVDVLRLGAAGEMENATEQTKHSIVLGSAAAFQPTNDAETDLGRLETAFKSLHLAQSVRIGGVQVLGQQAPAIAPASSDEDLSAKLNEILDVLTHHGLIAES